MGWDISYHPIDREEVCNIYFRGLREPEFCDVLGERFEVDDFYVEQMRRRFSEARQLNETEPFNSSHALYIAILFGFLRKYHYIRGGAFSFLCDDPRFSGYISDWKSLVPIEYKDRSFENRLTENYCGGVFLDHDALLRLRADFEADLYVREKLEELFSEGRLQIFWKAVDGAIAQKLGLLEASEVFEPNPDDLNLSKSLSNFYNCYQDGPYLYADAAALQVAEALAHFAAKDKEKEKLGELSGLRRSVSKIWRKWRDK